MNVVNSNDCHAECKDHTECSYWTYNTMNGMCWLKHGKGSTFELSIAVSGPKYCKAIEDEE